MRVLVFESNLLWSSKLSRGLKGLGHDAVVISDAKIPEISGDLAIVNLSQTHPDPLELIVVLRDHGVKVIAHAGHKEKDLLSLGKAAGADLLATNGELAGRLEDVLRRATQ